jgi:hypothetical protein
MTSPPIPLSRLERGNRGSGGIGGEVIVIPVSQTINFRLIGLNNIPKQTT